MGKKLKIVILLLITITENVLAWGFHAHKEINRNAVFLLPNNSLFVFFKSNIEYLTENAVNADKRRYILEDEACKHFIDLDSYSINGSEKLPKYYTEAKLKFHKDTLSLHGILPWQIALVQHNLTQAMVEKDAAKILKIAADLGHYIGDSNVPLHTTHNYDGQYTNQKGIHALWETRIPELTSIKFDYLIGRAEYVKDIQSIAWKCVTESNEAVDSVLLFENKITNVFPIDQKYNFKETANGLTKVYSEAFAIKYSELLDGQIERQFRKSIKTVADFWYTSWIEAGSPDLSKINISKETIEEPEKDLKITNERYLESNRNCDHNHINTTKEIVISKSNY